ncbi:multidrug efflux SMR transporter [Azospirillum sp. TSO22-1]|uniref:DMT family transporter n=1 Tax=Azospirillum sp. TSO22-1 TaxID=716789 RepID=UPI000D6148E3|nr:multidrug efflux SMR transporter [Azospirillum sp. TSO22-1]PWC54885.1 ligand-binding protein SH3 [Azospirillum sp. TSO22-1]
MGWVYLSVAIGFEIAGTTAMKLSDGMTRLWPALAVVLCYSVSFTLLAWALRSLEVGVAYAVWSAVGTMAIAAIGILVFGEGVGTMKLLGLALIVAGVVSLRLAGPGA